MSDEELRSRRQTWKRLAGIREAAELDARRTEVMNRRLRALLTHDAIATPNPPPAIEATTSAQEDHERSQTIAG